MAVVHATPAPPLPDSPAAAQSHCCPLYQETVELIGRRWTGAIIAVLLQSEPMRFSEVAAAVPQLSDRLLSERMKELEARGFIVRDVHPGPPVRVTYTLTDMGRGLGPAIKALHDWARAWMSPAARA